MKGSTDYDRGPCTSNLPERKIVGKLRNKSERENSEVHNIRSRGETNPVSAQSPHLSGKTFAFLGRELDDMYI